MSEHDRDGDADGEDPFEGLTLDEAFVNDAKVREAAASDRVPRLQRIDAEHRRIVEEARAHVREQSKAASPPHAGDADPSPATTVGPARRARSCSSPSSGCGPARVAGDTASSGDSGSTQTNPFDRQSGSQAFQVTGGQPPAGREEQAQPIGEPAPLPDNTGPFAFVATQANEKDPVAYDPCRPIHVVVNSRTAPPEGDQLFRNALTAVGTSTGLQFVIDGPTAEAPTADRRIYQPDRYPDEWAPVLVAWSDTAESPDLAGAIAGYGGSNWLQLPDGSVYVTGSVVLDGPDLADLTERGGHTTWRKGSSSTSSVTSSASTT